MNRSRQRALRQRTRIALYCLGVLCACEDFDPPAPARVAPIDAGSGATRVPVAPSARPDAGPGALAAPAVIAVATRNHVLVADPREHAVAVLDARSLSVQLTACGDVEATDLYAAEQGEVALAIDRAGGRACALRIEDGEVYSSGVAIAPHVNRVEFSPDARFALAYHDLARRVPGEPARGAQELSAIDLRGQVATSATVVLGTQPRAVAFSADGQHAVVLGADGIARFELAAATRGEVALHPVRDYGIEPWHRAQVRLAAGGEHALLFERDSALVYRVDLVREEVETIDLAAWARAHAGTAVPAVPGEPRVADALISRDGASAWLALRGAQALVALPELAAPLSLERALIGGQPSDRLRWTGDDERALLVYAGEPEDGRAALVSPGLPGEPRRVRLARAPERVLTSASGAALALSHEATPSSPAGYTLLRVRDAAARFRATEPAPIALALASDGGALAAVVAGDGARDAELHVLDVASFAQRVHALPGIPLAVGFTGDGGHAYAQLAHPDGRLALFELASGELRTATGFLIAGRVQE